MDKFQWEDQVIAAFRIYGRSFIGHEHEDVKQGCRLAIVEAGDKVNSPAYAYTVARNYIRKLVKDRSKARMFSLSDPKTMWVAEVASSYTSDVDRGLDGETVSKALWELAPIERNILRWLFGIGVDKKTEQEVSVLTGLTRRKIHTLKESGLRKLREVIGAS